MPDYLNNLKDLSKLPSKQVKKYIRKKAISNTKKNLTDNGKDIKEIPWEEIKELTAGQRTVLQSAVLISLHLYILNLDFVSMRVNSGDRVPKLFLMVMKIMSCKQLKV